MGEKLLASAAVTLARRLGVSSLHITFASEGEWMRLGALGFLQRTDQQFHWHNQGYGSFDDFLATLASRKRKAIRRERAEATASGIEIEHVTRERDHGGALGRVLRLLHGHRQPQMGQPLSQPPVLLTTRRAHGRSLPARSRQAAPADTSPAPST